MRTVRVLCLSDTHMRHAELVLPAADLIVHAGDFTRRGTRDEVVAFLDWYARVDAPRVLVGGNHDFFAEREPEAMAELCAERDIEWLLDREVEVSGLRIFGAPWTPRFHGMAYNVDRGAALRAKWALIPEGLDILITHGPPHGQLDRVLFGARVGCEELARALVEKRPRLHVFGHIHEARGEVRSEGAPHLVNAACMNLLGRVRRPTLVTTDLPGEGDA
jgi:Icc-related predicted phosphoesterase